LVPIATFLAGSLLTLLLPVALLIALVVWYWWVSVRVPNTAERSEPGTAPSTANPAPFASTPAASNAAPAAANPAPAASNPAPRAPSETSPPAQEV
jgi:hypothetical protein